MVCASTAISLKLLNTVDINMYFRSIDVVDHIEPKPFVVDVFQQGFT
ncbi:hypothetical protein COLO4_00139 [Corchorus olitorius]|uniref:Uncharacterized protein n=1 Tax=Corchorus olitorius TaxID=93759 RepID=A0A1R3L4H6_9ROSI|nr:hypothetical protein COLO4_00139 [Corchorus olitorius]